MAEKSIHPIIVATVPGRFRTRPQASTVKRSNLTLGPPFIHGRIITPFSVPGSGLWQAKNLQPATTPYASCGLSNRRNCAFLAIPLALRRCAALPVAPRYRVFGMVARDV